MKKILIKNERFVYYHKLDKPFIFLSIQHLTLQEIYTPTSAYITYLNSLHNPIIISWDSPQTRLYSILRNNWA